MPVILIFVCFKPLFFSIKLGYVFIISKNILFFARSKVVYSFRCYNLLIILLTKIQ